MPFGLLALAAGAFGVGLTEFGIAGLLPEIAASFHVSEATAGFLVTGYALSVAIGAIVVTAIAVRYNRRRVVMALMLLFIAGNFICGIAGSYDIMLMGRIVAALCHGAFMGIGMVMAADLGPPDKRARSIALVSAGLTTANVLGVPLGTLLGQHQGWRATYIAITIIGVLALVGIAIFVPASIETNNRSPVRLRTEFGAFRSVQVWLSLVITVFGFGGTFGAFTYMAYTLTRVSHFATGTIPWLLILFGVGMFFGNFAGGRAADWSLRKSLAIVLIVLTLVMALFALTAGNKVMAVILILSMGTVGFAVGPTLQMQVIRFAEHAPTMASSANVAAFNIGNALGSWLSGLAISAGLGFASPLWNGALMAFVALLVLVVAMRLQSIAATSNVSDDRKLALDTEQTSNLETLRFAGTVEPDLREG